MVLKYLFVVLAAISNSLANNNNEWDSRALETYFTRFGSRIDQLILRLDHLDNRINRFTSVVQGRLDNVENSLTTTKLRMDLWAEELSRIEEQLTRKWKNLEAKFDLIVPSIDSKLETKLTLIQRDNRRHNEHISNSLLNMGQRVDNSNDKVVSTLLENHVNASMMIHKCNTMVAQLMDINSTSSGSSSKESKLLTLLEDFGNKSADVVKSGSKVSNMFDDLIRRSDIIQTGIKDTLNVANSTRREIQDSLRLSQLKMRASAVSGTSIGDGGNGLSSTETMSAVIVEALASVESMSTAMGRRMADLGRSIEERFEMVSMTLNGFLESCIRIQDGTPLIEEHIAAILEKLLDSFGNNTRTSHDEMYLINEKLDSLLNVTCTSPTLDELFGQFMEQETTTASTTSTPYSPNFYPDSSTRAVNPYESRTAEILQNSSDLTEDEKKSLWESLFPNDKSSNNTSNNL